MAFAIATVVKVTGQAWILNSDGSLTTLHSGSLVPVDATIKTAPGASVIVQPEGGIPLTIGDVQDDMPPRSERVDAVRDSPGAQTSADPERGDVTIPPWEEAHRIAMQSLPADESPTVRENNHGGENDSGAGSFVRLVRITETTGRTLFLNETKLGSREPDIVVGGRAPVARWSDDPFVPESVLIASSTDVSAGAAVDAPPGGTPVETGVVTPSNDARIEVRSAVWPIKAFASKPVNTPPSAADDKAQTEEKSIAQGNVLANDVDPDGGTLRVTRAGAKDVLAKGPVAEDQASEHPVVGHPESEHPMPEHPVSEHPAPEQAAEEMLTVPAEGLIVAGSAGGTFIIHQDGSYIFDPREDFHHLAEGETKKTAIAYMVSDGQGGTSTAMLEVTVTGTNDAPTVSGEDSGTIGEDAALPISGQLLVKDVDANDEHVWSVKSDPKGNYGTLTIDQNGKWTYTIDDRAQSLVAGQREIETFTVQVDDGKGGIAEQEVTVTVEGANDVATVTDSAIEFTEDHDLADDTVLMAPGQVTVEDADAGERGIRSVVFKNSTGNDNKALGRLEFNGEDGTYVYVLDNSHPVVQSLAGGQRIVETYIVTSRDGTGTGHITVIINGTNDEPKVGNSAGSVTAGNNVNQQNQLTVSKRVPITDTDAGESRFRPDARLDYSTGGDGSPIGELTFNTDGTYTYAVDNDDPAVRGLHYGESITQVYTVTSHDGTATSTITITVNGIDDEAVVTPHTPGSDKGTLTEDITLDALGKLDIADADHDQSSFQAQNATVTKYGTFSIDADGNWKYRLNNEDKLIQALGAGETLSEDVPVLTSDGTKTFIEITIHGTNDAPTVSGDHAGELSEDMTSSISRQLFAKDIDANDFHHVWLVKDDPKGKYGTLTIEQNGAWTYTVDERVQSLAAAKEAIETFTVLVDDGKGGVTEQEVNVTVKGANDVPQVTDSAASMTEDRDIVDEHFLEAGGKATIKDADAGESLFLRDAVFESSTGNGNVPLGILKFGEDGTYTYRVDNNHPVLQGLDAGQSIVETYRVTSKDGTAKSTITITIHGQSDRATITPHKDGDDQGKVIEDRIFIAGGKLDVFDPSPNESQFQVQSRTPGQYGEFSIDADGNWKYELRNSDQVVQQLSQDETRTESFKVRSLDGSAEQIVTVTIVGTNDKPAIGGTLNGSVTEDIERTVTGQLSVSDKDIGDRHTWTVDGPAKGKYGSLSLDPDQPGKWIYTVDQKAIQALAKHQKELDTFTVKVDDGRGGTDTRTVAIVLTGANDEPTITADPGPTQPPGPVNPGTPGRAGDLGTVIEDIRTQTSGKLKIVDPDHGESAFKPKTETDNYGTFTIDANGAWTYTLNNSHPSVQGLSGKDSLPPRVFEVSSLDGTTTHKVMVDIIGTNDAPTAANSWATMKLGGKHTFTVDDFNFRDSHGEHDSLRDIIITRMPNSGSLTLNGARMKAGDSISAYDIAHGKLVYTPGSDRKDTSFGFKVRDDGGTANGGADTSAEYSFNLAANNLIVGDNGDTGGPNATGKLPGLQGGSGENIIVGDAGGKISVVVPGNSYNIVMMLDCSNSMTRSSGNPDNQTRIDLLKGVMTKLLQSLEGHVGGSVNLAVITFSDEARTIVDIQGLKKENIKEVLAQINAINPEGGTNYVEPFKEATRWFAKQPTQVEGRDYHNVSYFVTDGNPTHAKGVSTNFSTSEVLKASMEAFQPLAKVSAVYAVGMGESGKDNLQFFDNTPAVGSQSQGNGSHYAEILATKERDLIGDIERNLGGNYTVQTPPQKLKAEEAFSFDLGSYDPAKRPEACAWKVQKLSNGSWKTVHSGDTDRGPNTFSVDTDGEYRLVFFRQPQVAGRSNDQTYLKAIAIVTPTRVDGMASQPDMVKHPRELKTALSMGAFREELAAVGRDQIDGGPRNDILFGDSINTDRLRLKDSSAGSGNSDTEKKYAGHGIQGLQDYLIDLRSKSTQDEDRGSRQKDRAELKQEEHKELTQEERLERMQQDLYEYISKHHKELNAPGDMRGSDDIIRGLGGDDVAYGQGGNDRIDGGPGNDWTDGGPGNDWIDGGPGKDTVLGRTGNDVMRGGAGSDTFKWLRGDGGTAADPAVDIIEDFDRQSVRDGGDILDLRDLLPDLAGDDLSNYLHFERQGSDTVLNVSTTGQTRNPVAPAVDQKIVLQGLDLTNNGQLSDAAIVKNLVEQGKLLTALSEAHS